MRCCSGQNVDDVMSSGALSVGKKRIDPRVWPLKRESVLSLPHPKTKVVYRHESLRGVTSDCSCAACSVPHPGKERYFQVHQSQRTEILDRGRPKDIV